MAKLILNEDDLNPISRKIAKDGYKRFDKKRDIANAKNLELKKSLSFDDKDISDMLDKNNMTKDEYKKYVNDRVDELFPVPESNDYKLDKDMPKNIERQNYPYYVTFYVKSHVYEPAEGGYYVEVQDAASSQGYDTYDEAKSDLEEYIADDVDYVDDNGMHQEGKWHSIGKDAYEWEGKYVGEGEMIRIETNRNYLSAVKTYNGYEAMSKKYKSLERPSKLNEDVINMLGDEKLILKEDVSDDIRKNNLKYNPENDSYYSEDDDATAEFQDRESHMTAYDTVTDKWGNKAIGRKLDKQPRVSSNTWGRVWKKNGEFKQFEGPKYKVRQDVARYLDEDTENTPKRKTTVSTYHNKRNPNKHMEVHDDGYGHRSYRQYMKWNKGEIWDDGAGNRFVQDRDVKNFTGDGNLHRMRRPYHREVIDQDYELDEGFYSMMYDDAYDKTPKSLRNTATPLYVVRNEQGDEILGRNLDELEDNRNWREHNDNNGMWTVVKEVQGTPRYQSVSFRKPKYKDGTLTKGAKILVDVYKNGPQTIDELNSHANKLGKIDFFNDARRFGLLYRKNGLVYPGQNLEAYINEFNLLDENLNEKLTLDEGIDAPNNMSWDSARVFDIVQYCVSKGFDVNRTYAVVKNQMDKEGSTYPNATVLKHAVYEAYDEVEV